MILEALGGIHVLNYNDDELNKMVFREKAAVTRWYKDYVDHHKSKPIWVSFDGKYAYKFE